MVVGIRTKDIDKLLGLFQQLEKLLNPKLPEKNKELWEKSLQQANKELAKQLEVRQSKFTLRPDGNIPTRRNIKSTLQEAQQRINKRILQIAEKKYCEKDPTYAKAVDQAKSKTVDVLKRIDHLLLAVQEPLLQFPRVKKSLLAVDWREHIRNYYPFLDKDNFSYQIREAIDVLEALKLQFERQQPNEVESKQLSLEKPAEKEQKDALSTGRRIIGWIFKKTSHFICAIVVAVIATVIAAIIIDIFADFGWIDQIKRLFTK